MHHLYRHWDKEDKLLYVGISLHAVARLIGHRKEAEWFDSIAKITIEQHATKEDAERAEVTAIKAERPIWNKAHAHVEDTVVLIRFPDRTYYLDESFVVTERKRKYDGLLPVTELDKLSKQARYKLAHAAEIRARDKERKAAARMAAKKAFKAQKLTEVTNG